MIVWWFFFCLNFLLLLIIFVVMSFYFPFYFFIFSFIIFIFIFYFIYVFKFHFYCYMSVVTNVFDIFNNSNNGSTNCNNEFYYNTLNSKNDNDINNCNYIMWKYYYLQNHNNLNIVCNEDVNNNSSCVLDLNNCLSISSLLSNNYDSIFMIKDVSVSFLRWHRICVSVSFSSLWFLDLYSINNNRNLLINDISSILYSDNIVLNKSCMENFIINNNNSSSSLLNLNSLNNNWFEKL